MKLYSNVWNSYVLIGYIRFTYVIHVNHVYYSVNIILTICYARNIITFKRFVKTFDFKNC